MNDILLTANLWQDHILKGLRSPTRQDMEVNTSHEVSRIAWKWQYSSEDKDNEKNGARAFCVSFNPDIVIYHTICQTCDFPMSRTGYIIGPL